MNAFVDPPLYQWGDLLPLALLAAYRLEPRVGLHDGFVATRVLERDILPVGPAGLNDRDRRAVRPGGQQAIVLDQHAHVVHDLIFEFDAHPDPTRMVRRRLRGPAPEMRHADCR